MGWCCGGAKCHIAPHLLQLGWAKPLLDVVVPNMPVGRALTFTVPELALSNKNMVRIRPVWRRASNKASNAYIYVSYRAPAGYDGGILKEWTNAVFVHTYVEGDAASLPMAEARLGKGAVWKNRALGVSVSVKAMNGTDATATLTRVS